MKKLDANLVENTYMNNRANLYHHVFDSSKDDAHTECNKKFTMGSNIAKKKSKGEGTSTCNNTTRVKRSGEGAKQLFPKKCMICKYSGAIKIKRKNSSHVC